MMGGREVEVLAIEPLGTRSYKVVVRGVGEPSWSYNGMRFSDRRKAEEAGQDLYRRWTGMDAFEVQPSEDEPNA